MPKTIVIRDSSIAELVLGDKHIHTYTADKKEPQPKNDRVVEDVPFEEVNSRFCYITPKCVKDNMVEHVEKHLRAACYGTAQELWECIHQYELMDYLSTESEDASKIYGAIKEYFMPLGYTDRQFRKKR